MFDKIFSAQVVFAPRVKIIILGIAVLLISCYFLVGSILNYIIFLLIHVLYLYTSTYRLILFLIGLKLPEATAQTTEKIKINDNTLPTYTVLIPLLNEAAVIRNLKRFLLELDYPPDKIQILLIIEEKDFLTLRAIEEENFPQHFQLIVVPFSFPQTKGKACNYALQFATGEYITIFDAEDRPHPLQLKAVIQEFNKSGRDVACIQCRLCFYNAKENWLTQMFALEFTHLFNYTLPTVASLRYPLPLGGTSNHIKTHLLRLLGGWDSYNVTEDAALGLKITLAGFRTIMLNSYTKEEAPITIKAWIKQRTRWIKGYLHTYLIYIQHPALLYQKYRVDGFIFFHYFIFISPFLMITVPVTIYFSLTTLYSCQSTELFFLTALIRYLSFFNLGYGFIHFAFIAYKVSHIKMVENTKLWWTYPFYFILHIVAAVLATYKLIIEPHKWDKTEHGISKLS